MTPEDALDKCLEFWSAASGSEGLKDFRERSLRGDDYYACVQWSQDQRDTLRKEGRYPITANHIFPVVNNLMGMERDNRRDLNAVKRKGGYDAVARVLTALAKHTADLCGGDDVKSEWFGDGARAVRGHLKFEISYDTDPIDGQITMRCRPPLAVRVDPCRQNYDWNDPKTGAKFVIDTEWLDQSYVEATYPDKQKELESAAESAVAAGGGWLKGMVRRTVAYLFSDDEETDIDDDMGVVFDKDLFGRWRYRMVETWWREWAVRTVVMDRKNYDLFILNPAKKEDKAQIAQVKEMLVRFPDAYAIKEKYPVLILHMLRRVGEIVLDYKEDPFDGFNLYPIIPFTPYWANGYEISVIDNLIGPQDELNKRRTNVLEILQRQAHSGLIVEELADGYGNVLRDFGSSPGFIIERKKCGGHVEKIQPGTMPPQQVLSDISKQDIEEIGGVSAASRGYDPERKESGVLYEAKVRQAMQTTRVIFDNFSRSNRIAGHTLIELIRHTKTYSDEEIMQIIDEQDLVDDTLMDEARTILMQQNPPPQEPAPLLMAQLAPNMAEAVMLDYRRRADQYQAIMEPRARQAVKQQILELVRARRTGQYGVVISDMPSSPTLQMSLFAKLDSLAERYAGIFPPEAMARAILTSSGLPASVRDNLLEALPKPGETPTGAAA